jgi:hypothetical protein
MLSLTVSAIRETQLRHPVKDLPIQLGASDKAIDFAPGSRIMDFFFSAKLGKKEGRHHRERAGLQCGASSRP